ncbi:MAG TPA: prepilin-type N-terminal cleavage/methylation domain-containing protein [Patescibacteria group bacterium]|nr:prepilin-type N-terminal cleavage/methylation domain-containing protein [Patescibacteria group bacterium]
MPAQKRSSSGFTLFELLIAITVLAVLFIGSALTASAQLRKARDGRRKSDINRIKIALYDYYFDQGCFPETLPTCGQPLKLGETAYLNNFPCDPQGNPYVYQTDRTNCLWFKVLTNLENARDPDIDRIGCRTGCGPDCQYNYGLASTNITVYDGCVRYFACNPGGQCQEYDNPEQSQCPVTYKNDPNCAGLCPTSTKSGRCKDASGKQEPGANEPPTKSPEGPAKKGPK